ELAEEIFEAPVRIGQPWRVGGLQDVVKSPMYATGVGLVLYGLRQSNGNGHQRSGKLWGRVRERVNELFREIF
ncbi:MAG: cell division protein FtsA, partial [Candidatus Binatia bacterium]